MKIIQTYSEYILIMQFMQVISGWCVCVVLFQISY